MLWLCIVADVFQILKTYGELWTYKVLQQKRILIRAQFRTNNGCRGSNFIRYCVSFLAMTRRPLLWDIVYPSSQWPAGHCYEILCILPRNAPQAIVMRYCVSFLAMTRRPLLWDIVYPSSQCPAGHCYGILCSLRGRYNEFHINY